MRKIIRELIDDLRKEDIRETKGKKNFIPPIPAAPTDAPTTHYDVPPPPSVPEDLNNQTLSQDPEQKVLQLDWQAQQVEERETLE